MADEHKHGEMDITAQQKAFDGLMRYVSWGAVISLLVLVFAYLVNG